jgi:hypothetical protein
LHANFVLPVECFGKQPRTELQLPNEQPPLESESLTTPPRMRLALEVHVALELCWSADRRVLPTRVDRSFYRAETGVLNQARAVKKGFRPRDS